MKRILFYYPSNKRSVQIETTLVELRKAGQQVLLLTTCTKGLLHQQLEKQQIFTYTHISKFTFPPLYYLNQFFYLIRFCRKHKIELVFSNLQHSNFIGVFAQTEALFDKVINTLSQKIIVPSKGVYKGIKEFEKVKLTKLKIIPYLYDFSKYASPNLNHVNQLKEKYKSKLLIVMVARLIPFKRHLLMLPVYKKLIEEGLDIKVLILDEGPYKNKIASYITEHNLEHHIFLIGFTTHFLEYMKSSDILIHPSLTEASNNVVKEIGLMSKAVAVCEGVGDFDDYIIDNKNGYLMSIKKPEKDAERILREVYQNKKKRIEIGKNLHETILSTFGNNDSALKMYEDLIASYE